MLVYAGFSHGVVRLPRELSVPAQQLEARTSGESDRRVFQSCCCFFCFARGEKRTFFPPIIFFRNLFFSRSKTAPLCTIIKLFWLAKDVFARRRCEKISFRFVFASCGLQSGWEGLARDEPFVARSLRSGVDPHAPCVDSCTKLRHDLAGLIVHHVLSLPLSRSVGRTLYFEFYFSRCGLIIRVRSQIVIIFLSSDGSRLTAPATCMVDKKTKSAGCHDARHLNDAQTTGSSSSTAAAVLDVVQYFSFQFSIQFQMLWVCVLLTVVTAVLYY